MKQFLHKGTSILMAFVVLFSTMSFTIDMHYCGDKLVETAIFHKVKGCGMDTQKSESKDCKLTKKNCCSDKQVVVDGQDELQITLDKISFNQQVFILAFVETYNKLFQLLDKEVISFQTYKPPLVIRQIFKLDETYLI